MSSTRRVLRPGWVRIAWVPILALVPVTWLLTGPTLLLLLISGSLALVDMLVARPYLIATCGLRPASSRCVVAQPDGLWTVEITNAGDAVAHVLAVRHVVHITPDATGGGGTVAEGDGAAVARALARAGYVNDRDVLVDDLSAGTALAARGTRTLFELPTALADRLIRLDTNVVVEGRDHERVEYAFSALRTRKEGPE